MANILSIETSTTVCSVAVHSDGKIVAEITTHKDHSHSSLLNSAINNILDLSGLDLKQLNAIAISKGPGSYTGLRIGTSTAKGLCYALDIPLISINTLEAMAAGIQNVAKWYLCPMLDARRMEVYCSIFSDKLEVLEPTSSIVLDSQTFSSQLGQSEILFFGNGSDKFQEVLQNKNAHFLNDVHTNASSMGKLAYNKYQNSDFEDTAYFEPFYLKEFLATKPKSIL